MAEKSHQKRSTKKVGKSLKEKRVDKKTKADDPAPIGFKAAKKPSGS